MDMLKCGSSCLQANLHERLNALNSRGKSGLGTGQAARLGTGGWSGLCLFVVPLRSMLQSLSLLVSS